MVLQALNHFKVARQGKTFNMVHCWKEIKDCPKWQDLYASRTNNGGSNPNQGTQSYVINLDGANPSASRIPKRLRKDQLQGKCKVRGFLVGIARVDQDNASR